MPFKAKKQPYITVMSVILAVVIAVYGVRIFSIQVLNREKYNSSVSGITVQTTEIKAPRGEILDRDGRKIAVNRDGYDIVFNFAYINRSAINELIVQLIKMCAASADEYVDNLPLSKTAPYGFSDENAQAKIVKFLGLADYATAEDCFARFVEKYKLEQYDAETQRQIMGVRYSMDKIEFSIAAPYTFAEDVSETLMLQISEASFILEGVTISVTPYREYSIGNLAPHLIGTVGPIYEEEWEAYKEKGDTIKWLDTVKEGVSLFPEIQQFIGGLMDYYLSKGMIEEALAEIDKQLAVGKTPFLLHVKSVLLNEKRDYEGAMAVADEIIAMGGEFQAEAYAMKGNCYYNPAQLLLLANNELSLEDPKYNANLAKIKDAYAKAMPFYEQAQKLAPQNTALWGNPLLRIYYDLNKATEYDILSKELGY